MNRLWLFFLVFFTFGLVVKAAIIPPLRNIYNPFSGRQDFIIDVSTMSIGFFVDVSTNSIADGECLVWSSANSQFEPGSCAAVAAVDELLLENGDFVLLENGDKIILE